MANYREISKRIRSVENNRQITRTMELVATSKLKRTTDRVRAARPYSAALSEVTRSLHDPEFAQQFPLLRQPATIQRAAVLLLTANRGLCGAFNANLIKQARATLDDLRGQGIETELHLLGRKGIAFFRFRREPMESTRTDIGDNPTVDDAEDLIAPLRDKYERGEVDAVFVIGAEFLSAMSTPPRVTELLPIRPGESAISADQYILSPGGAEIIGRLLPLYLRNVVYGALVENAAAEQGARRAAMKAATDNAGEMLEHLTRTKNRARQAQITQEIAEIVGGSAALE